jgi:hypothetical protein
VILWSVVSCIVEYEKVVVVYCAFKAGLGYVSKICRRRKKERANSVKYTWGILIVWYTLD